MSKVVNEAQFQLFNALIPVLTYVIEFIFAFWISGTLVKSGQFSK
jgi:hypothetical protein